MKIINISLLLFLICHFGFSQSDSLKIQSIDKKVFFINEKNGAEIKKLSKRIDSIKLRITEYRNKIIIISEFENSKSIVIANFYIDNEKLIFASFMEQSSKNKNDSEKKFSEYYFDNCEIIRKNFFTELSSFAICLPIPKDDNHFEYFGFNKTLTDEFHIKYIEILKEKLVSE